MTREIAHARIDGLVPMLTNLHANPILVQIKAAFVKIGSFRRYFGGSVLGFFHLFCHRGFGRLRVDTADQACGGQGSGLLLALATIAQIHTPFLLALDALRQRKLLLVVVVILLLVFSSAITIIVIVIITTTVAAAAIVIFVLGADELRRCG